MVWNLWPAYEPCSEHRTVYRLAPAFRDQRTMINGWSRYIDNDNISNEIVQEDTDIWVNGITK